MLTSRGGYSAVLCLLISLQMLSQPCRVGALIQLFTECPNSTSRTSEGGGCSNACTRNSQCRRWDTWCCPNSCGGRSCTVVRAACYIGRDYYSHHSSMPLPEGSCGQCWCQNGMRNCLFYDCDGAQP